MSDMNSKYTLDDWKNERIPKPPYSNVDLTREEWKKIFGLKRYLNRVLYWNSHPKEEPRITDQVLGKIWQAKKDVVEETVNRNVVKLIQLLQFRCKNTPEHEMADVIKLEIQTQKEVLKETGLSKQVKQRNLGYEHVTPALYQEMKEKDDYFEFFIDPEKDEDGNTLLFMPDSFKGFQAYQTYRLIQTLENLLSSYKDQKEPWEKLSSETKSKVKEIAHYIDQDGRSDYQYEEVKTYLSVYKAYPELQTCSERKKFAKELLNKKASKRLDKARPNTLSTSWQQKLHKAL